jgi:hypothetical protein
MEAPPKSNGERDILRRVVQPDRACQASVRIPSCEGRPPNGSAITELAPRAIVVDRSHACIQP